jgi:hypothetical protein
LLREFENPHLGVGSLAPALYRSKQKLVAEVAYREPLAGIEDRGFNQP